MRTWMKLCNKPDRARWCSSSATSPTGPSSTGLRRPPACSWRNDAWQPGSSPGVVGDRRDAANGRTGFLRRAGLDRGRRRAPVVADCLLPSRGNLLQPGAARIHTLRRFVMRPLLLSLLAALLLPAVLFAQKLDYISDVEGQPLGENAKRL